MGLAGSHLIFLPGNCLFEKFDNWKWPIFEMRSCFQGKILQQIEIRSWSNGVCCSHCISFRWHFWHIYFISNHFIIKNKVLSYHGWNSEKRSTVANYLYFLSNKNKHTFISLFILRIFHDNSNFWKASQPLSKPNNHALNFVTPC